ncbi:hypothetical protein FACS1894217_02820 [Clostridia bacterium]|nr:hypothetical protein FACS1894217_02820 [Clostridia bacterium]
MTGDKTYTPEKTYARDKGFAQELNPLTWVVSAVYSLIIVLQIYGFVVIRALSFDNIYMLYDMLALGVTLPVSFCLLLKEGSRNITATQKPDPKQAQVLSYALMGAGAAIFASCVAYTYIPWQAIGVGYVAGGVIAVLLVGTVITCGVCALDFLRGRDELVFPLCLAVGIGIMLVNISGFLPDMSDLHATRQSAWACGGLLGLSIVVSLVCSRLFRRID